MRRRLVLLLVSLACAVLVVPASLAENPAWPPTTAVTPADLTDRATWPDDPGYAGQWNWWSWAPPEAVTRENFRAEEDAMGSGTWTDMAWQHTTGDKRVIIAVLDSGINWDEPDLANQHFLNRAELEAAAATEARCLPQAPAGHMGDPVDIDGDGFLTMRDWFSGQTAMDAAALRTSLDASGNTNGLADPGDLIVLCTDGTDDDANGYTDDISGWDFFADDNDPSDDTRFGHGTGEARDSAAEGNNGMGGIGHCPGCRILMVRVGDSFVVDAQDYAQSVIFATDSGASVIQEALGSLNNTTFMRRANDYAYDNGAVIIASAADENSRHHNYPGTANHTLYVHAIVYDGGNVRSSDTFLAFNNCTNFGGQLVLSAPGTGCSSEATGVTSGVAGLIYSAGIAADRPGGPLSPALSAEEVRQLLLMEAQDIYVPESQVSHPNHQRWKYPSLEGWDQRFGYGRVNSYNSVLAVREGRIPPEVDFVYPDWFRVIYPSQTPTVTLRGHIDARRATDFDYVIEWAAGIEPADADFTEIAAATAQTAAVTGDLTTWDVSGLTIDNPVELNEIENRYTVTVRIRVTAHYGGAAGDVVGEQRRVFAIHNDPSLLPGFPVALGVRNAADEYPAASGEGSPKLADLDGDNKLEIVYADTDGLLHAFNEDGTEMPGFPVQLGILRGYDPAAPDNLLGAPAYMSGAVPTADLASSVILGVPAIGDLDNDGAIEIVVPTMEGDIYVIRPDGSVAPGWPVGLPEVLSPPIPPCGWDPANPDATVERGIVPAPALADLDLGLTARGRGRGLRWSPLRVPS